MVEVKCQMCGKIFLAKQSNYNLCSPECRKARVKQLNRSENYTLQRKNYYKEKRSKGTSYYEKRYAEYSAKNRVIKYCEICGTELPNGKQKFCLDCLLKGWQNGDKRCRRILECRGYDATMIREEIDQRNGIV